MEQLPSSPRFFILTTYSLVLNPKAANYRKLKDTWNEDYVDNQWAEDSIFLERNSRDFVSRIDRIGVNAEAICDVLSAHPRGKSRSLENFSSAAKQYNNSQASQLSKNKSHTSQLREMPQPQRRLWWSAIRDLSHQRRHRRFLRRFGHGQRTKPGNKLYTELAVRNSGSLR